MSNLRAGVAGVGHLGYHHARHYAALDGVTLVGVADVDGQKRARAATDFSVPGVATVGELIGLGVDVVSVVTPTVTHHDVVLELLEAGVHVLVEKPIASSIEAA